MLPLVFEDLFLELSRPLRGLGLGFPLLELSSSLRPGSFYVACLIPAPRVRKSAWDWKLLTTEIVTGIAPTSVDS